MIYRRQAVSCSCKLNQLVIKTNGTRVHFALRLEMLKSPIARLPAIFLDFINRPSGETEVKFDAAVTDLNSRQFKTPMKKMAAQVDFYLLFSAFLSCLQFRA